MRDQFHQSAATLQVHTKIEVTPPYALLCMAKEQPESTSSKAFHKMLDKLNPPVFFLL